MKKLYILSLLMVGTLSFGQVTLPHYEGFNYASGAPLQTQTGWTLLNTGDDLAIATGNLTYTGLAASTGNKVTFGGAGIDAIKNFTSQNSGTVYYSLLLNISSMAGVTDANGGYFAALTETNTNFAATLWVKRVDDSNFNIGIETRSASAAATTWTSTAYATGQTLFIVVSYTFNPSTSDDVTKLWVNPTPGSAEPTPTITDTHTGTDIGALTNFLLRQDSVTETPPNMEVDELRIATTWAGVTTANLSVKENQIAGLNIYPNPVTNGKFSISTNANAEKSVVIFDVLGKQVVKTTATETVNVSNLNAGVYIVKITEEGKTATRKLIIK